MKTNTLYTLCLFLVCSFSNVSNAQSLRDTVHVGTAGTLAALIPDSVRTKLTELKVTGLINGQDVNYLRNNVSGIGTGKLEVIDLSEVSIKTGGSPSVSADNVLPEDAFSGCSKLKSILLPNQLISIQNYAFHGCTGLKSLIIPDSVTNIGDYALTNCSTLVSVRFPKKLRTVGNYSFANCILLDTVNLPEGTTSLGFRSFWTCLAVKSVTLPQTITSIGDGSFFMWRQIQTITIPDNVTSLGDYMFTSSYKLDSVHLPAKLTRIGTEALFACVVLKHINWPTGIKEIGDHAFKYCFELTDVRLSEGLLSIGVGAFERDFKMKTAQLPNSLASLSNDIFLDCNILEKCTIPSGIKSIPTNAFKNCYKLQSITVPPLVSTIGNAAFASCRSLKSITFPASLTSMSNYAFDSTYLESIVCEGQVPPTITSTTFAPVVYDNSSIVVPKSALTVYKAATFWRNFRKLGMEPLAVPIYLSVNLADNGYFKQKVVKDSTFTCYLIAKDGWKINTVLLNDSDVTAKVDTSGLFKTPALVGNTILNVSFEKVLKVSTSNIDSNIKVYSDDKSIVVRGAEPGSRIQLFNTSGQLLKTMTVNSDLERIPVSAPDIYLIRTSGKVFKLAL
jgi:hypothetical protein